MRRTLLIPPTRTAAGAFLLAACAAAASQPVQQGRLLYETHCIECHTTQMHWRARRAATDWDALRAQVTRWQQSLQLRWTDGEIEAVSAYLNETIYRHPRPQAVSLAAVRRGP